MAVDETRQNLARVHATGPFLASVLSRVVAMMAARADFPLDRLEDALLLTDALAAHAHDHSPDGRVSVAVRTTGSRLELAAGPFADGTGRQVINSAALPGLGNVLERVADSVAVRPSDAGDGELVVVELRLERTPSATAGA